VLVVFVEPQLVSLGKRHQRIYAWLHKPMRAEIEWHSGREIFSVGAATDSMRSLEQNEVLLKPLQFLCGSQARSAGSNDYYLCTGHCVKSK
jgi:hypothetical protein